MSNDFVARKIGGVGWIVCDSSQLITCGTDEPEILDALEAHLGRPVARLEESPIEDFEATLRLAIASTLTNDREAFDSITQQLTAGESNSIELKSVVGLLTQQVQTLSERNAVLERERLRREKTEHFTNYLTASGVSQQDFPQMLNLMLRREGL
jgi:hypothetical protein